MTRRRLALLGGAGLALAILGIAVERFARFPAQTVPEGAYLRITYNLSRGDVLQVFPYLEDAAQHACFTIRDYRKKARALVEGAYPEPDRGRLLEELRPHAEAPDGADVFVDLAKRRGWVGRLRKDLSGVAAVEIDGERATVVTARGTRYAFRRRSNGIWGLTLFTADLLAEAERAARDLDVVERAAADYALPE